MKNSIQISLLFLFIGTVSSCKKDATTKAEVNEEGQVSTNSGTSLNVNLETSQVLWEGSKPTGKHNGFVKLKSGELSIADGKVNGGNFVLDMNTITDQSVEGGMKQSLEAHLKGTAEGKEDDFFNVTKYPTSTFAITKVTVLANDPNVTHLVYGNLTIRDITKEIGFKANISIDDQGVKISTPSFAINRADFEIKFMSKSFFDDLKEKFIDDNINLQIELSAS